MRRFRLCTIMALIAVIALSLWVGMQIEKARSASRSSKLISYTVMRPVYHVSPTGQRYTVVRPVRETRYQTRPQ